MTTITPAASRRTRTVHSLFATAATTALLACTSAGIACAEDARVNDMSFEIQSPYKGALLTVTSTDGRRWDKIERGSHVSFNAVMQVDTAHPGYVERVGVWLGKCTNTECANHTRVFAAEPMSRDYNKSEMINVPIEKFFDAAPNVFGTRYHDLVLKKCNDGHTDASVTHEPLMDVDASFSVNTRKKSGSLPVSEVLPEGQELAFNGGDHTRHDTFLVVIRCVGKPRTADDGKDRNRQPHRVKETRQEIDLFLSTYRVPESGPRGATCAPLKVTTRIGTGEAGPLNVKLWRQVNGGPITSEQKQMHASALGGGHFGDDWSKFEQFSKTTTIQYKAEILGGTFAPSTPWKSITIHCNGDYAPPQSNANPDSSMPPVPPRGRPQVELPPTVTPPPACGTKAAKVRGSAPCVKVAPLPDQRKQLAEQKRREAAAQKRLAAKEVELRRREAALRTASDMRQHHEMHRPLGRPGLFGGGLRRPLGGFMRPGLRF